MPDAGVRCLTEIPSARAIEAFNDSQPLVRILVRQGEHREWAYAWVHETRGGRRWAKWRCVNCTDRFGSDVYTSTGRNVNFSGPVFCSNCTEKVAIFGAPLPLDSFPSGDYAAMSPRAFGEIIAKTRWQPTTGASRDVVFGGTISINDPSQLFKCHFGHEFRSRVLDVLDSGCWLCPVCSGLELLPGVNDLLTLWPEGRRQGASTDVLAETPFGKPIEVECPLGHLYETGWRDDEPTCPACLRRETGSSSAGRDFPQLRGLFDPNANHPYRSLDEVNSQGRLDRDYWWWRCDVHGPWEATLHRALNGATTCPRCELVERSADDPGWATSRREQALFAAMKEYLPGLELGASLDVPWLTSRTAKVDMFEARLALVIEYDSGWHRGRERQDLAKTTALLSAGLKVVRIRDRIVPEMPVIPGLLEIRVSPKWDVERVVDEVWPATKQFLLDAA